MPFVYTRNSTSSCLFTLGGDPVGIGAELRTQTILSTVEEERLQSFPIYDRRTQHVGEYNRDIFCTYEGSCLSTMAFVVPRICVNAGYASFAQIHAGGGKI